MNGDMLSGLTGKLRSLAHQQLEAREADGPLVRRLRDVVSTVNDLLGKPIRPDAVGDASATVIPFFSSSLWYSARAARRALKSIICTRE